MAEMVIAVRDGGGYKKGDVIEVFNDKFILQKTGEGLKNLPIREDSNQAKSFLWITIDDCTDEEAKAMMAGEYDDEGLPIKKRIKKINWEKDLGLSAKQIENIKNPDLSTIDLRNRPSKKAKDIVKLKDMISIER